MDEAARKYLSEITKAGQKKRVQRGLPVSHVPIGYRVVNGLIGLDPETATKIREAFAMKENGKTLHDIRYFLTKEGVTSKSGNILAISTVHAILSNSFYYGKIKYRGKIYKGKHPAMCEEVAS